ncbi:MAG: YvcK family protein [Coriobacteriia bacterium]|nr:YvcK family protein [Coriobacteriia bacterium]
MKAVVIGGGTGAPVSIKILRSLGVKTNAVVAMADDGGSSGMLREHTGRVPPGDVRKCIVSMARDPQSPWAKAFAERFGYINNHTLGNLMLHALEDVTHSFTDAIRLCEELLDAQGHVYPSTLESVVLKGITRDGQRLVGQSMLGKSKTALAQVSLVPAEPRPNQEAIDVLLDADLIVLGPGSLFTSIIPNLLVPGVLEAVRASSACKVFVCSLGDMQGETWGLTASEHVEAVLDHGLRGALDVVIVHRNAEAVATPAGTVTGVFRAISQDNLSQRNRVQAGTHTGTGAHTGMHTGASAYAPAYTPASASAYDAPAQAFAHTHALRSVTFTREDAERIRQAGSLLIARDLRDATRPTWHDRNKLAEVFKEVIRACHLPQR